MSLESLFGTTDAITWGQEIARALLVFTYGLAAVRITGRRVFGRWAALDIVVAIIVGSSLSRAMTGNAPLWGTIAATTALMIVHWLLAQAVSRSSPLSHFLEGKAVRLAPGGVLDQRSLKYHSVSDAALGEALREAGVERLEDVRDIVLEPSGKLIAIKR